MRTYWIVRENGIIVAAMLDSFCGTDEGRMYRLEDLTKFAATGPVERISTDESVTIGGTLENFIRPSA